jgi:hypothetical protein
MVGIWSLEFRTGHLGEDTLTRPVLGTISLTLNEEGRSAPGFEEEPPMFFGTYDIPFERAGFELSPTSGIPAVVGRIRGDSVDLKLAPDSRLTIIMTGVLDHDSIAGRWATEYRRAGIDGAGRFVLRRR